MRLVLSRDRAHLALAMSLLACGGCGASRDAAVDAAEAPARTTPLAPSAAAEGRVISRVDGAPITIEEVAEVARKTGLTPLEALRRLQEERVLVARAEAAGLGDAPEVADAARRAAVQALLERRVEDLVTPSSIPAERVQKRIAAQQSRFARPERRRSLHVLAALAEGAPPEGVAAAERFARRSIERLRAAPDPVAEARAIESEERDRAGRSFRVRVEELPPAARDAQLVPEYLEALYSQGAPGVVPEPARTRFGWHAIVLTEIVPPWRAPADEVEEIVREELTIEARAQRLEELVGELAEGTHIELDQAAITQALETDLLERGDDAP